MTPRPRHKSETARRNPFSGNSMKRSKAQVHAWLVWPRPQPPPPERPRSAQHSSGASEGFPPCSFHYLLLATLESLRHALCACRWRVHRIPPTSPRKQKEKGLRRNVRKPLICMVPGGGLEPSTPGSTIQCSNQLSYPGNDCGKAWRPPQLRRAGLQPYPNEEVVYAVFRACVKNAAGPRGCVMLRRGTLQCWDIAGNCCPRVA